MEVKYPHVKVKLVGENGNAFAVLGQVKKALKQAGVSADDVQAFLNEAMSGDYDHLLQVVMQTVDVE